MTARSHSHATPWLVAMVWVSLTCHPHRASADEVVTLAALERLARERTDLEANSRAELIAAEAQVDDVRASYRPNLSVAAQSSVVPGSQVIEVTDVRGQAYRVQGSRAFGDQGAFDVALRYSGGLRMQGLLYDFGRTATGVRAAHSAHAAARFDADAEQERLVIAVRSAYVQWYAATLQLRLADRMRDDAGEQLARVEASSELGATPGSDILLARYAEMNARLRRQRSAQELDTARLQLEHLTGRPLPEAAQPETDLSRYVVEPTKIDDDPHLLALNHQEAAMRTQAEYQQSSWRPSLGYAAQAGAQGLNQTVFPAGTVELNVAMSLWQGGRERRQAHVARARAQALRARAASLRASLQRKAERASALRAQANAQHELAQAALQLAQQALALAEELYRSTGGTLQPVLDARARVVQAESELIAARTVVALAALGLEP